MAKGSNNALLGAGVLAAIASSLCCIGPAIAAIASISGLASTFSWIDPARPYIIGFTVLALGAAWYLKLRPAKAEADDCGCEVETKKSFFQSTKFLAIMTVFAAFMLSFPLYAHLFYPSSEKQVVIVHESNIVEGKLTIQGMTCTGCENHISTALMEQEAVIEVMASYEEGSAIIKFDKTKASVDELGKVVEDETGYVVLNAELLK